MTFAPALTIAAMLAIAGIGCEPSSPSTDSSRSDSADKTVPRDAADRAGPFAAARFVGWGERLHVGLFQGPDAFRRLETDAWRFTGTCIRRIRRTPATERLFALALEQPLAVYSPHSTSAGYGIASFKKGAFVCLFNFNERIVDLIAKIPRNAVYRTVGTDEVMLWGIGAEVGLVAPRSEAVRWLVMVMDLLEVPRPPVSDYIKAPEFESWETYIAHMEKRAREEGGQSYSKEIEDGIVARIEAEFFSGKPQAVDPPQGPADSADGGD